MSDDAVENLLRLSLGCEPFDEPIEIYIRPESGTDRIVADDVITNGNYNFISMHSGPRVMRYYDSLVLAGKTPLIVDAGANIGASALYFRRFFPDAKIFAIEPEQGNFDVLTANCAGETGIELFHGGLSDTVESLFNEDPGLGDWGFRTSNAGTVEVRAITLNAILAAQPANVLPFLCKIDIEGAERKVFESNTEWLDTMPCLVLELHDWMFPGESSSRNFYRAIAARSFDLISRGENIFAYNNAVLPFGLEPDLSAERDNLIAHSLENYLAGDFAACITSAGRALTIDPYSSVAWANVCCAENMLGAFDEGRRAGKRAVCCDPKNEYAKANLEWSLRELAARA